MKKLLATGFAIVAAATVAITAAPASAFSIGFGSDFGHGDWDDHYWHDDGVYIEFDVDDYDYDYDDSYSNWDAHVDYCEERYQTYDPDTNLYYYAVGEQTECDSPYM